LVLQKKSRLLNFLKEKQIYIKRQYLQGKTVFLPLCHEPVSVLLCDGHLTATRNFLSFALGNCWSCGAAGFYTLHRPALPNSSTLLLHLLLQFPTSGPHMCYKELWNCCMRRHIRAVFRQSPIFTAASPQEHRYWRWVPRSVLGTRSFLKHTAAASTAERSTHR